MPVHSFKAKNNMLHPYISERTKQINKNGSSPAKHCLVEIGHMLGTIESWQHLCYEVTYLYSWKWYFEYFKRQLNTHLYRQLYLCRQTLNTWTGFQLKCFGAGLFNTIQMTYITNIIILVMGMISKLSQAWWTFKERPFRSQITNTGHLWPAW